MTGIGIALIGVGVALVWAGIRNEPFTQLVHDTFTGGVKAPAAAPAAGLAIPAGPGNGGVGADGVPNLLRKPGP